MTSPPRCGSDSLRDWIAVGVCCGHCGVEVHMVTCDEMRDTGHTWVLWSKCLGCGAMHATDEGCLDCEDER